MSCTLPLYVIKQAQLKQAQLKHAGFSCVLALAWITIQLHASYISMMYWMKVNDPSSPYLVWISGSKEVFFIDSSIGVDRGVHQTIGIRLTTIVLGRGERLISSIDITLSHTHCVIPHFPNTRCWKVTANCWYAVGTVVITRNTTRSNCGLYRL